ncbi:hypothetical protein SAMN00790413_03491 [Deinococcus hopiensis KR-140]|uniref:Uncharacterized protein n=1 Tax=Deinococcus hopiensis KR-140 TaxID=695939 RepID=A0A1W1UX36_9DEIO|nr:hypothetical protein SAMN00790413_03491 [Deinococcus hopiensis KR-140]
MERPFTVMEGLVAIVGNELNFPLPPGATWPGLAALPGRMAERVQLVGTYIVPGTRITPHVTPRDLESGVAYVHGLLLLLSQGLERLAVLERTVHPRSLNQTVAGAMVGTVRERLAKWLSDRYALSRKST